jgi:hypothetical protein
MSNKIMRAEYPRPQMKREAWRNLNGEWDMMFDFGKSGEERELYLGENLKKQELCKKNAQLYTFQYHWTV